MGAEKQARNEVIVAAYREIGNLREVGDQFGITYQRVQQIIVQHEKRTGETISRNRRRRPQFIKSVVVHCVDCGRERIAVPSKIRPVERCRYCAPTVNRKVSDEQIESAIRRVRAGGFVRPRGKRLTHWGAIAREYGMTQWHMLPRTAFLYLQHRRRYAEIDALWPVLPHWLKRWERPRIMEVAE